MAADYIPFELQEQIMKRLPVKSLIQFRSVSKPWKSLIDSSGFIKHYSSQHQQQHLLVRYEGRLVRYRDPDGNDYKYVSIVDDDSFPNQKFSLTLPLLVEMLRRPRIISISHGLSCLYDRDYHRDGRRKDLAVLWNISIRKAIAVVVPNPTYANVLGFGVCRVTTDPKIVKVTQIVSWKDMESPCTTHYQVEVFSLSTRVWRSPHGNVPCKPFGFKLYNQVAVDGVCYWLVSERVTMDAEFSLNTLILSFDMTSEEFIEITLPNRLACQSNLILSLSKLKESLVVFEYDEVVMSEFVVWMMVDGVPKSFTKLFTITPNRDVLATGFRMTDEPLIEILVQGDDRAELAVYKPDSKHIENLGIDGIGKSFSVHPYKETLLLLDQPDFMVYNGTVS